MKDLFMLLLLVGFFVIGMIRKKDVIMKLKARQLAGIAISFIIIWSAAFGSIYYVGYLIEILFNIDFIRIILQIILVVFVLFVANFVLTYILRKLAPSLLR